MRNNTIKSLLMVTAIICLASGSAMAGIGVGARAGWKSANSNQGDPNQFVVGVHYSTPAYFKGLFARPTVDYGMGGGIKDITVNLNVIGMRHEDMNSGWTFFLSGGPAWIVKYEKLSDYKDIYGYGYGFGYGSYYGNQYGNIEFGNNIWGGINISTGLQHKKGFTIDFGTRVRINTCKKFTFGWTF
jgi:hypothetical protein